MMNFLKKVPLFALLATMIFTFSSPSSAFAELPTVTNMQGGANDGSGFTFNHVTPVTKGSFLITAYTNGIVETGKKPGDPGYGKTSTGTTATANRTIAVDPSVIPYGSVVQIDGYPGYFIAEDIGGAIKGNHIDMFYASEKDVQNYPNPHKNVTIVGTADLTKLGGTMTGNGGGGAGGSSVPEAKKGEVVTTEFRQQIDQMKQNSSIMDSFMIGQAENLFNIGGINSLQNLVFGDPYSVWLDQPQPMLYHLFSDVEFESIIKPMCSLFTGAYGVFVVLAIMLSALKFGVGALRPQARADFWQDINMWVLSAFFVSTFLWFSQILFGFNQGIVDGISKILSKQNVDISGASIIAGANGNFTFGDIFIFLGEWVLALYMNIIYVSRKIVIMFLMILAPVAAISLLYARTRFFFGTWIKEFIGNIFLQSVHAIVLGVFALIAAKTDPGFLFKLGMLVMSVPVSGLLSKWLNMGDSSSMLGKTAAMTGLGSLASLGMLAKGMNDMRKGGRGNVPTADSGGGSNGSDMASDTGKTGISSLLSGSNSPGWGKLKRFSGMIGMGTGAIAGSVLGPMGAGVGGAIGRKVGELAPQLTRQIAAGAVMGTMGAVRGVGNLQKQAPNPTGNVFKDTLSGAKEAWNDLSLRRETAGKVGELVGGMVGFGAQGRALGQMMSGVSRSRIMGEEYGNRDLQDYAQKYPGANVQWRQNSSGSAFYRQEANGNWQQISPTGAADATLKNGEERRIDYQFNNGSPWIRQENGTYTLGTTNPSFSPAARAQGIGTNAYGRAGSVSRAATLAGAASVASGPSMVGSANTAVENIANQILSGPAQVASASQAPDMSVASHNPFQSSAPAVANQPVTVVSGPLPSTTATPAKPGSVNPEDGGSLAQVAGSIPPALGTGSPITSGPVTSGVPLAPVGTVGEIVSHQVAGQSSPVYDTRQVIGLTGSTAQLGRTSSAYVVGANGQQFEDRRINPASINPDAYFANNTQGRGDQRTAQDKMADVVHSAGVGTAQAWTRSVELVRPNRHSGVI